MAEGHAFICLTTGLFVTVNFMAHSGEFNILAPLSAYPKQIGLRIIILITPFHHILMPPWDFFLYVCKLIMD